MRILFDMAEITIPFAMLPTDGRFGSGPSKIRSEQINTLLNSAQTLLGTSHRQADIKSIVANIQQGLRTMFHIPDEYEVVLGNGGASAMWDIICCSLIQHRASVAIYGSFSEKMAKACERAPFLDQPTITRAEYGAWCLPQYDPEADLYAWPHNETSTGVAHEIVKPSYMNNALVAVDGTSAAGALPIDITQTDVYYFSPQKAMGSEGGLWIAILSPKAVERAYDIQNNADNTRWIPEFLSLTTAIEQSRKHQTLNTPALATLILMNEQIQWINNQGGLSWSSNHCRQSANIVYTWAEQSAYANPFVTNPDYRSHSVVTVDIDESIAVNDILEALRNNGIRDVFPYRKLGRNQLRIGVFPSVNTEDVEALLRCIDYVVEQLISD